MTAIPSTSAADSPPMPTAGFATGVAIAASIVALLLYAPTLTASYSQDDLDYLYQAGQVIAGKQPYWTTIFRPHLEHVVPLLRAAFHASALWFGVNTLPLRLTVLFSHVASAWLLGLIAFRYAGRSAGYAAALAYVIPVGFSFTWIVAPVGAGMPFGLVGVLLVALAAAYQRALGTGPSSVLAVLGLLLAAASESTLFALLLFPAALAQWEHARGARGISALACLCVAAILSWSLSLAIFVGPRDSHVAPDVSTVAARAAALIAVAPLRYVAPVNLDGVSLSDGALALAAGAAGVIVGVLFVAPFAWSWRRSIPPLATVSVLSALGPLAWITLVAIGRGRSSFLTLYTAERYFFPLSIPAALFVGAAVNEIVSRLRDSAPRIRRIGFAFLLAFVAAEAIYHRQTMLRYAPFEVWATHQRRFDEVTRLYERLNRAASKLPAGAPAIVVPDGKLNFLDIHNNRISTAVLVDVIGRNGDPRLVVGDVEVSARDAEILNPIFEDWAASIDDKGPLPRVIEGRLEDLRENGVVDFRFGPQDRRVVSGFGRWFDRRRPLSGRGELRLAAKGPHLSFFLGLPDCPQLDGDLSTDPVRVAVSAFEEPSGDRIDLGTIEVRYRTFHRLALNAEALRPSFGKPVRLILEVLGPPASARGDALSHRRHPLLIVRVAFAE